MLSNRGFCLSLLYLPPNFLPNYYCIQICLPFEWWMSSFEFQKISCLCWMDVKIRWKARARFNLFEIAGGYQFSFQRRKENCAEDFNLESWCSNSNIQVFLQTFQFHPLRTSLPKTKYNFNSRVPDTFWQKPLPNFGCPLSLWAKFASTRARIPFVCGAAKCARKEFVALIHLLFMRRLESPRPVS